MSLLRLARGLFESPAFVTRALSTDQMLLFKCSPILLAEPLKKKKKLDPQIIKQREDRKKKKLEKQIRRLEKNARQLKPINELELPLELLDDKTRRTRTTKDLTEEDLERRISLQRLWAHFKLKQKIEDFQAIDRLFCFQQKALEELRKESEDLYVEAIQFDAHLVPCKVNGPVATPSIKDYDNPDGEYLVISKNWG